MELLKQKIIRLKGKALRELNDAIHERDDDRCIVCGAWVDRGVKFHHEHNGIKSDVMEQGVTLCYPCHQARHSSGEKSKEIKMKCREYLISLYGKDIWNAGDGGDRE